MATGGRLSSIITAATTVGFNGIFKGQLAPVARLSLNMRRMQYTDDEIMLMTKALLTSATKQDAREAWHVLDRRRIGSMPSDELLQSLTDMLGVPSQKPLERIIAALPSRRTALVRGADQLVTQSEFTTLCTEVARAIDHVMPAQLTGIIAEEASDWASGAVRDVGHVGRAWSALELEVVTRVPPPLLPRAGAVVERMLAAGCTPRQASTAVAALYCKRDARAR